MTKTKSPLSRLSITHRERTFPRGESPPPPFSRRVYGKSGLTNIIAKPAGIHRVCVEKEIARTGQR